MTEVHNSPEIVSIPCDLIFIFELFNCVAIENYGRRKEVSKNIILYLRVGGRATVTAGLLCLVMTLIEAMN